MYTDPRFYNLIPPIKKDKKWIDLTVQIYSRDLYLCRLTPLLSKNELAELNNNGKYLVSIVDPAHVLRRSTYPQLKYEPHNIVILNRYSHSQLDQFRNPINGKYIGEKESIIFWKKILGLKQLECLQNVLKNLKIYGGLE